MKQNVHFSVIKIGVKGWRAQRKLVLIAKSKKIPLRKLTLNEALKVRRFSVDNKEVREICKVQGREKDILC